MRPMTTTTLAFGVLLAVASAARAEEASVVDSPHVRVELLARTEGVRRGASTTVGVSYLLDEHWHVYWKFPGDSGAPPRIELAAAGATIGPLQWPTPERIATPDLVTFGYHDSALITATLDVPRDFEGDTLTLTAGLEWLVCDPEGCIPGFAELRLVLPVTDEAPAKNAAAVRRFDAAAVLVPRPLLAADALVHATDDGLLIEPLDAELRAALASNAAVAFFPERDGVIAREGARITPDGMLLLPRVDGEPVAVGARLTGVLSVGETASRRGFALDSSVVAVSSTGRSVAQSGADASPVAAESTPMRWPVSLLLALLLLVGGVWSVKSGAAPRARSEE